MSKYRLWDTHTRTMIYPDDCTDSNTLYAIGLHGLAIAINLDPDSSEPVVDWTAGRRLIAMASTGSPDKHGREIYAKDVLLLEGVARGVVESANGSYYVRTNDHSMPLQAIAPELREIVGNVYENILHLPKRTLNLPTVTIGFLEVPSPTPCEDARNEQVGTISAQAMQRLKEKHIELDWDEA